MESLPYFTSPIRVANDAVLLRTLSRRSVQPLIGLLRGEGAELQLREQCTRFVLCSQYVLTQNRTPIRDRRCLAWCLESGMNHKGRIDHEEASLGVHYSGSRNSFHCSQLCGDYRCQEQG